MFDPIIGPPDVHSGPAVGHSTEKGDTWHAAVGKLNAGFEKVWHALSGGASVAVEAVDDKAREAFNALREAHDKLAQDNAGLLERFEHYEGVLSELLFKVDSLVERVAALTTPPAAPPIDPSLDAVAAALSAGA